MCRRPASKPFARPLSIAASRSSEEHKLMALPYYVSPEQMMQDKAEYARKGIARGKSIIVREYADGMLLVAENPSASLNKISEIYDRIAFAGAGRYSEFENLRKAGIRYADLKGFAYDREDVTAKSLANAYSQTIGNVFSEAMKPLEVEILVVEVADGTLPNELYRITFDGSIGDEKGFVAIGGQAEELRLYLKDKYEAGLDQQAAHRGAGSREQREGQAAESGGGGSGA